MSLVGLAWPLTDKLCLGFYEAIRTNLNKALKKRPEEQLAYTSLTAGAITGCIGGMAFHPPFDFSDLA